MNDKYLIRNNGNLQPREKALKYGVSRLNDNELLKILIGSGQKNCSVDLIASKLIKVLDNHKGLPSVESLMEIKGMGMAKSSLIAAALEFSRRHYLSTGKKINHPGEVFPLLAHMADRPQEYFFTISLNGAHEHIKTRQISQGLLNKTIVHPREVFSDAVSDRAAALIVAHNHPSGNLEASREDKEITKRLQEAGEILGIPLLDHIIFGTKGYISLLESGCF